jgi:uncharacterized protein YndB with AHSA1/START domain
MTTQIIHDLVVTRVFDAPIEEVWKAWTDSATVMQWWGPDGFTAPLANMDVREGGKSLVCMSAPQLGFHENYSTWEYRKIVPHERIEYIHNLSDKDGNKLDPTALGMPADFPQDVLNVITFKVLSPTQTEMVVAEYGDYTEQWYTLSKTGLEQCLDKMAAIFAKA